MVSLTQENEDGSESYEYSEGDRVLITEDQWLGDSVTKKGTRAIVVRVTPGSHLTAFLDVRIMRSKSVIHVPTWDLIPLPRTKTKKRAHALTRHIYASLTK